MKIKQALELQGITTLKELENAIDDHYIDMAYNMGYEHGNLMGEGLGKVKGFFTGLFFGAVIAFSFWFLSVAEAETKYCRVPLILDRVISDYSIPDSRINFMVNRVKNIYRTQLKIKLKIDLRQSEDFEFKLYLPRQIFDYLEFKQKIPLPPGPLYHVLAPPLVFGAEHGGPENPWMIQGGASRPLIYFKDGEKIIEHCLMENSGSISTAIYKEQGDVVIFKSIANFIHELGHQLGAWHDQIQYSFMNPSSYDDAVNSKVFSKFRFKAAAKKDIYMCLEKRGFQLQ